MAHLKKKKITKMEIKRFFLKKAQFRHISVQAIRSTNLGGDIKLYRTPFPAYLDVVLYVHNKITSSLYRLLYDGCWTASTYFD